MGGYDDRNAILRAMGYLDYRAYLGSLRWVEIRKRAFRAKGSKCVLCGGKTTQIHHESYTEAVLAGIDLGPLHPICVPCHKAIETTPDGWKRSFEETAEIFAERMNRPAPRPARAPKKKKQKRGRKGWKGKPKKNREVPEMRVRCGKLYASCGCVLLPLSPTSPRNLSPPMLMHEKCKGKNHRQDVLVGYWKWHFGGRWANPPK